MTPTIVAPSAPLAVLAAYGVVSVLVVPTPPTVECPECRGEETVYCTDQHCDPDDGDRHEHLVECPACDGSGRVPFSGRAHLATPDTEPEPARIGDYWYEATWGDEYALLNEAGEPFPVPLGRVVASCTIECVPIVEINWCDTIPGTGEAIEDASPSNGGWYVTNTQRQFQDFPAGAFALLLNDVQPTTERCPECWGRGLVPGRIFDGASVGLVSCGVCDDTGKCDPYPVPDNTETQ